MEGSTQRFYPRRFLDRTRFVCVMIIQTLTTIIASVVGFVAVQNTLAIHSYISVGCAVIAGTAAAGGTLRYLVPTIHRGWKR